MDPDEHHHRRSTLPIPVSNLYWRTRSVLLLVPRKGPVHSIEIRLALFLRREIDYIPDK